MRSRAAIRRPLATLAGAALGLVLLACAMVDDALPCWVDVRIDHRARDGAEPVTPTTLADASRLVDARLGAYGVERTVFTWQTDELVVGLPDEWATDDVMELIVASGWVAFVPVPDDEEAPEQGEQVPGAWPELMGSVEVLAVEMSADGGQAGLTFRFTERGSQILAGWSRGNIGNQLVIAVDGAVVFAPIIQQPLAADMQLVAERRRLEWLASLLAFEPLPITLERTSVEDVDTAECAQD